MRRGRRRGKAVRWVAVAVLAVLASGCTAVRYSPETREVKYVSVMQKKMLLVTEESDSASGRKTLRVEFSTDSDPAVALLREAKALAGK